MDLWKLIQIGENVPFDIGTKGLIRIQGTYNPNPDFAGFLWMVFWGMLILCAGGIFGALLDDWKEIRRKKKLEAGIDD